MLVDRLLLLSLYRAEKQRVLRTIKQMEAKKRVDEKPYTFRFLFWTFTCSDVSDEREYIKMNWRSVCDLDDKIAEMYHGTAQEVEIHAGEYQRLRAR